MEISRFLRERRSSGVLLHVSSLPSEFGIGDLGPMARRWVDRLTDAGQQIWQILPLVPSAEGNSPYSGLSAYAGSVNLISPQQLVLDGFLPKNHPLPKAPAGSKVNFRRVGELKRRLIDQAWQLYRARSARERQALLNFSEEEKDWLDDYALFMALRCKFPGLHWTDWPEPIRNRRASAVAEAQRELSPIIDRHRFEQFVFFQQIDRLRKYARSRGVHLMGDVPIFVCSDSAEVWSHSHLFKLDKRGKPTVVAGVPPDYFSRTGQRWGNPLYNWKAMEREHFAWWVARFAHQLRHSDILRIDHFRGFAGCWEIPADAATAVEGRWVKSPGQSLFAAVKKALGGLPFIAEDLGTITPDVVQLRESLALPGMRVLHFGFGDSASDHLPCNYTHNCVAYSGTHDNDTTVGWYRTLGKEARAHLHNYLGERPHDVAWQLIQLAWSSVANIAMAPMQDVLSLGSRARMNTPNGTVGNWRWRLDEAQMEGDWGHRLASLTDACGRSPQRPPHPKSAKHLTENRNRDS